MKDLEPRFPLCWPVGVPRTPRPTCSAFGAHSTDRAVTEIQRNVELLMGRYLIISTNVAYRQDGMPYSSRRPASDHGVAVYFTLGERRVCMPCDRWDKIEHNLWAIAKHLEAMRGMERWGVGSIDQAFTGYLALPAPEPRPDWWKVMGVKRDTAIATVQDVFRDLAKKRHPDSVEGSHEAFVELNNAMADFITERGI